MIRKSIPTLTMIVLGLLVTISCSSPTLAPTDTPEPEIPTHFSTYTSEGLFTVSYPPDRVSAISAMEDVFEAARESVMSEEPESVVEEAQILFLAGKPVDGGYTPNVNVMVVPRSIGYWTLDEIVDAERYHEYSQTRVTVDGRDAVILDSERYDPRIGMARHLQLLTIKDKFMWLVTCGIDLEDFKDYEDTLNSIVRSLRILK